MRSAEKSGPAPAYSIGWRSAWIQPGAAQRAVDNWINSPGHFETMIDPRCDCIGVGVTQYDGITYCYMFVGIPNSV